MDQDKDTFFQEIKEELTDYVKLRIELFRVSSYEKIARVTAAVFSGLLIMTLFLFFTIFVSIVAGFYLSELSGSPVMGFGLVAGFYFLLLIFVVAFRKQLVEKAIINKMIAVLFEHDEPKQS